MAHLIMVNKAAYVSKQNSQFRDAIGCALISPKSHLRVLSLMTQAHISAEHWVAHLMDTINYLKKIIEAFSPKNISENVTRTFVQHRWIPCSGQSLVHQEVEMIKNPVITEWLTITWWNPWKTVTSCHLAEFKMKGILLELDILLAGGCVQAKSQRWFFFNQHPVFFNC